MFSTPNMSLTSWTDLNDAFNHEELAANWVAIDAHDHSSAKGVPVPTGGLAALAVTTAKLATGAVTSDKVASGLDGAKLSDGTVGTAKLADASITSAKFASLPQCRALSGSAFAIPNNTATAVQFTGTRFMAPSSMWSIANATRVVAPVAGVYQVSAMLAWASNVTGVRRLHLLHNGTTTIAGDSRGSTTADTLQQTSTTVYRFAANDYVEVFAFQTSGGSLNLTQSATVAAPELALVFLGP